MMFRKNYKAESRAVVEPLETIIFYMLRFQLENLNFLIISLMKKYYETSFSIENN